MKRTVLAALLLACGAAQASDWKELRSKPKGNRTFVDVSSLVVSGDIRRIWWKGIPRPNTVKAPNDKWIEYMVARSAIDSRQGTATDESVVYYLADKSILAPLPAAMYGEATEEPVPPDTIGDDILKFVCALPKGEPK